MTRDLIEEIEEYRVYYNSFYEELGRTTGVYRDFDTFKNAKDFYDSLFEEERIARIKPFKLVVVYRHFEVVSESI